MGRIGFFCILHWISMEMKDVVRRPPHQLRRIDGHTRHFWRIDGHMAENKRAFLPFVELSRESGVCPGREVPARGGCSASPWSEGTRPGKCSRTSPASAAPAPKYIFTTRQPCCNDVVAVPRISFTCSCTKSHDFYHRNCAFLLRMHCAGQMKSDVPRISCTCTKTHLYYSRIHAGYGRHKTVKSSFWPWLSTEKSLKRCEFPLRSNFGEERPLKV